MREGEGLCDTLVWMMYWSAPGRGSMATPSCVDCGGYRCTYDLHVIVSPGSKVAAVCQMRGLEHSHHCRRGTIWIKYIFGPNPLVCKNLF